jgi:3-oxoacyl-[acyl-carrier-protein] synthase-1
MALLGHPVVDVAGFQGEARLLALALPALEELLAEAGADGPAKTALFLAVPSLTERAELAGANAPASLGLLEQLCELGGPGPLTLTRTFCDGPVGFALALQAASAALASRTADRVIVGAVDTWCDDLALEALEAHGRLKGPENPVGLQPGEAAAFLMLERSEDLRSASRGALASVTLVGLGQETGAEGALPRGQGLTDAIGQLLDQAGPLPAGKTWFVLDLNGEERRAYDWGCCSASLGLRAPGLLPAPVWLPAMSFGDTGAAGAALGVQLVLRSLARGYAPGTCAVVLSSADDGRRTAIRLEAPR